MNVTRTQYFRRIALIVFTLFTAQLTSACTSTSNLNGGVAQAYNSTGMFEVPTYTRSIFSSTNF